MWAKGVSPGLNTRLHRLLDMLLNTPSFLVKHSEHTARHNRPGEGPRKHPRCYDNVLRRLDLKGAAVFVNQGLGFLIYLIIRSSFRWVVTTVV